MKNIFLILFFSISVFAEGQVMFQKTYGGSGNDIVRSILQTSDGGYVFVAEANDLLGKIEIIKTNALGDTLWTKFFGSDIYDQPNSIQPTNDGGYIVAGALYNQTLQMLNAFLAKIDSAGTIMWIKEYTHGIFGERGFSAKQIDGGDYVLIGLIANGAAQQQDIFLIKTDSIGNEIWLQTYGGTDLDIGIDITETPNGFMLYGESHSVGYPYGRCLIATDTGGNISWSKRYGCSSSIYYDVKTFQKTNDGGFIFVSGSSAFLQKIDSFGNLSWTANYYHPQDNLLSYSISQTNDGGYIVTGMNEDSGKDYLFLIKINSIGDTLWAKTYGDSLSYSSGIVVQQTSDNGYIVAGSRFNGIATDIYLVKTDSLGNSGCVENNFTFNITLDTGGAIPLSFLGTSSAQVLSYIPTLNIRSGGGLGNPCLSTNESEIKNPQSEISLSPNPFHTTATLQIKNSETENKNCTLKIYNTLGALVHQSSFTNLQSVIISRNGLPDGLYFYQLQTKNFEPIGNGKFVVE